MPGYELVIKSEHKGPWVMNAERGAIGFLADFAVETQDAFVRNRSGGYQDQQQCECTPHSTAPNFASGTFAASSEDLARTVHAHPTLTEVVREAALAVDKRAIHG